MYRKGVKIHTDGSLLMDAWILLISHMLIGPLFNVCNLALLWRALKKLILKFRVWANKAKTITQLEANRIFEMPTFDPAFAYAEVIKDAYLVLFLQPLFPVAGLISLMSLFLLYWSQKWRLLRKSTRPVQIGLRPARTLTYLLSLSPLVYGVALVYHQLSITIFDHLLLGTTLWSAYAIFAFGLTALFIPYYKLISNLVLRLGFFKYKKSVHPTAIKKHRYSESRLKFFMEYDRSNPVTQNHAKKEYFAYLQSKLGDNENLKDITDQIALKMHQVQSDQVAYYSSQDSHNMVDQAEAIPSSILQEDSEFAASISPKNPLKRQGTVRRGVYNYFTQGVVGDLNPLALAAMDYSNNNLENGYLKLMLNSNGDRLIEEEPEMNSSGSFEEHFQQQDLIPPVEQDLSPSFYNRHSKHTSIIIPSNRSSLRPPALPNENNWILSDATKTNLMRNSTITDNMIMMDGHREKQVVDPSLILNEVEPEDREAATWKVLNLPDNNKANMSSKSESNPPKRILLN